MIVICAVNMGVRNITALCSQVNGNMTLESAKIYFTPSENVLYPFLILKMFSLHHLSINWPTCIILKFCLFVKYAGWIDFQLRCLPFIKVSTAFCPNPYLWPLPYWFLEIWLFYSWDLFLEWHYAVTFSWNFSNCQSITKLQYFLQNQT